jgi:hypothetical protein
MALVSSVAHFRDAVKSQLSQGDLDSALHLIHRVVDQIFCEPINTAQIFGSKLLDELCQDIGAMNWQRVRGEESPKPSDGLHNSARERIIVYVVSKLYTSGGHTAALADIIRLAPPARSVVLITGIGGATDHAAIQHRFESIPDVSFEYAPRGKHIQKLDWLQRRLLALVPVDVWLFNHHQDSVAVAAVQPDAGYQLHFYHHGDHHLCLGVHLNYTDHIDPHPMGFYNCQDELDIHGNRYLPLVVRDMGDRPAPFEFISGAGLVTCTAASFNKVEVPYFIRYVDVVPELLRVSGGKHIHIGRLTPMALSRIRSGMRKLGLPGSAFVYIPFVPSVWKALHEHQVDMYITSFPYGGARTLIEAMGAGVPVAVHSHCASRLLGTLDMAYEDALVWRNPKELYDFVQCVDATTLREQSRLARNRYLDFHREGILKNALADHAASLQVPPLYEGYAPDGLQQALDISNEVSCTGVVRRFLYRAYRKWRS